MKRILLICFCITVFTSTKAQSYNDTVSWQGFDRAFIVHIPAVYSSNDTVPLVFALHGLGDVASNFESFMGMNAVADTANFIVVYPQALVDPFTNNQTAFSSYINYLSSVDDVGLINYLIDTLITQFNIDTTRVYATGFSMGAFMTHRLACQLSNRLTAVASVSGQMALQLPDICNPTKEIPMMHIHGTADGTVRYNGYDSLQMLSVDSTLAIWQINNGCSSSPTSVSILPDNAPDNFITTAYRWIDCNNNSEILLYKVDSTDHQWLYSPANDFDTATEIWKFFMRHPNNGLVNGIGSSSENTQELLIYPNPASSRITINAKQGDEINIYDVMGRMIYCKNTIALTTEIDVTDWNNGVYFVRVGNMSNRFSKNYK
ncbi:MAG: T9SS type A sorting domain-containing protein [Flavobacteriales bacterium]|nr:T9SS type A sorting domain-containing protein [Flavobacteriales bacterium]